MAGPVGWTEWRWTEWDARAFARAAAVAALALALVGVVTAASDEGGLAWGVRAGRTLPLAPVCAAIGAWLALAPARARGDDRALAALGRSPWGRQAAAIAGGAAVALGAAIAIGAVPRVDVRGFYPRAEEAIRWRFDADKAEAAIARAENRNAGAGSAGTFVSGDGRWHIGADGSPTRAAESSADAGALASVPPTGRASAALATALAGLALPMITARTRSKRATAIALAAMASAALATVLAFQAAAAARAPPLVAPLPPLLLLGWAASRYRSGAWHRAKSRR